MKRNLLTITILLLGFISANSQTIITFSANQADELEANAGSDTDITSGESVTLGESPSAIGGTEPYSYSWSNGSTEVSTEANPSVNPEATTTYTLVVTDNATCTATANVTISIVITGINDFTRDELNIYPNPATDRFTIDYRGENGSISLFSEQGKHLWTMPLSGKTTFSAPRIPGVYMLKINASGKESMRRIVVSK